MVSEFGNTKCTDSSKKRGDMGSIGDNDEEVLVQFLLKKGRGVLLLVEFAVALATTIVVASLSVAWVARKPVVPFLGLPQPYFDKPGFLLYPDNLSICKCVHEDRYLHHSLGSVAAVHKNTPTRILHHCQQASL